MKRFPLGIQWLPYLEGYACSTYREVLLAPMSMMASRRQSLDFLYFFRRLLIFFFSLVLFFICFLSVCPSVCQCVAWRSGTEIGRRDWGGGEKGKKGRRENLSVWMSLCLSVSLSVCLNVCLSVHLNVCLSVQMSSCLSVYFCLLVCVCVCACVCVFMFLHLV
jgi:hypothetical protein